MSSETCLPCHADKNKGKNVHKAVEMGCETCHEGKPEEDAFTMSLVTEGNELCFVCHEDKRLDPAKTPQLHWPVLKGKCVTCHDPHSSANEHLLVKPLEGKTKEENLCLSCHETVAAWVVAKVQHPAIEMGCGTCHVNHKTGTTSEQEFQFHLTKSAPELCADCHDVSDKKLVEGHQGQPFEKARCTECHNPHGSERAKLINPFAHSPFAEKQCDVCHSPPQGGKVDLVEGGRRALCYMCHDERKTQIEQAKVPHGLFAKRDFCTDCHSPHAARHEHQLRRTTTRLCETCHTQRREEQLTKKFLHPPVFEVGCTVCHEPHGSDNVRRLRATINEVCLACHGQQSPPQAQDGVVTVFGKVQIPASALKGLRRISLVGNTMRGHPLMNHPISGANPLQPDAPVITCVTCHNPHAADGSKRRFVTETAGSTELCVKCHK